ncbi:Alpha/Beta hydrolase protein [Lasiosphaeris hirsuta]|uniref:Alpha/Beta hydrolase protein n=1 Tax=Lasiosphaeris hirsuta TaxID=260670 RepID=A0AA39ZVL9_9PEZI|nr:Alpha/Beta hydrolase protein [Lasiosphaeris hirsuta]
MAYDTPSATADAGSISPFRIEIPDFNLERMQALLRLTPIAGASFENSPPDGKRDLSVPREWLAQAKQTWETTFGWRAHEAHLNTFAHFKAAIPLSRSTTRLSIHFAALFSRSPLATPLVLLYGWPGSFVEFLPLLARLCEKYPGPATLPYHVIVLSLPGFVFSDAFPADRHRGNEDVARGAHHGGALRRLRRLVAELLPSAEARGGGGGGWTRVR